MQGKFIVIEGLEGAGKSSAIETVKNWLQQHGRQVFVTREPGGTPIAEKLRTLVKQPDDEKITPHTELLLMYACRVQLVENVIKPKLAKGIWVVGDRHDLSSQAYQGGGRELGRELLTNLKQLVLGEFKPDLTLYLDINPEVGLSRAKARGELDRIELEALEFFHRTREAYLSLAKEDETISTVNAEQDFDTVQRDIVQTLNQRLS